MGIASISQLRVSWALEWLGLSFDAMWGNLVLEICAGRAVSRPADRARLLLALKAAGRLMQNQDWIAWFDDELARLPQVASGQAQLQTPLQSP